MVNLAQEIELGSASVASHASARLQMIVEQMQALRSEAERVLQKAAQDLELHQAACSFKRSVGRVYHVYRRPEQVLYFSMLSPADHAGAPPHPYVASYRLEPDQSWTPAEETARLDAARAELERAFSGRLVLGS